MRSAPRVSIEQATNKGHTVTMHQPPGPKGEYREPMTKVYGKGEHEKMLGDVRAHLGIGGGKAAPMKKAPGPKMPMSKGSGIANQIAGSAATY